MFHVEHLFIKNNLIFMKVSGKLVDIHNRDIYPAYCSVWRGKISKN